MFDQPSMKIASASEVRNVLAEIAATDFPTIVELRQAVEPVLRALAQAPEILRELLDGSLPGACERDKDAVKLVLWRCPETKAALRLHRFLGSGPDRPHSHRWPFVTHILRGEYRHAIYAVSGDLREGLDLDDLILTTERIEREGTAYALDHRVIHVVDPDPDALTLMFRGPARSDKLLVIDQGAGDTYWHFGSTEAEGQQNRYSQTMNVQETNQEVGHILKVLGLAPSASSHNP